MLTVYLDHQDYSNLSNSRLLHTDPALQEVLRDLRLWHESSRVRFVFSNVVVGEMLPLDAFSVPAAVRRMQLLRCLCGENALLPWSELLKKEAQWLASDEAPKPEEVFSPIFWTPALGDILAGSPNAPTLEENIEMHLHKKGYDRSARRKLMPQILRTARRDKVAEVRAQLVSGAVCCPPSGEAILLQWAAGKITRAQANEGMVMSFQDVEWLASAAAFNVGLVSTFQSGIREPAMFAAKSMNKLVNTLAALPNAISADIGQSAGTGRAWWKSVEPQIIRSQINAIADFFDIQLPIEVSIASIRRSCPGLVAMIGSLHTSLGDSIHGNRQEKPNHSQYTDAIHATYAPYVDVFRADKYMSPHVRSQLAENKTVVVRRLVEINDEIRKRIEGMPEGLGNLHQNGGLTQR